MKIVEIDDGYINVLIKHFPRAMDNKVLTRKHTRKYLGVVFQIGHFYYYAPFSTPKARDYDSRGNIKRDSLFALHMIKEDANEKNVLLGTIRLINMIPVPLHYINVYPIENEKDICYRNVVLDEFVWISMNKHKIQKKARQLYFFKKNEKLMANAKNQKVYDAILPFTDIEEFLVQNNMVQIDIVGE